MTKGILHPLPTRQKAVTSEGFHAAPRCTECTGEHLKCLYMNTHSMRNKQEELVALVRFQSCNITGISETWWEESSDGSAVVYALKAFGER